MPKQKKVIEETVAIDYERAIHTIKVQISVVKSLLDEKERELTWVKNQQKKSNEKHN